MYSCVRFYEIRQWDNTVEYVYAMQHPEDPIDTIRILYDDSTCHKVSKQYFECMLNARPITIH